MRETSSKKQEISSQSVCKTSSLKAGNHPEKFERDNVTHVVETNDDNLSGKFHHLLNGQSFPSHDAINEALKKRAARKFASVLGD